MAENPFTIIEKRLEGLEALLIQVLTHQTENAFPSTSSQELMTIKEAAVYLSLAVPTLYALVSRREIPHFKRSGRLYFSKEELRAWVEEGRQKTRQDIRAGAPAFMRVSKRAAS